MGSGRTANWALDELDRLARAGAGVALLDELDRILERLFSGPYRRAAHVLQGAELDDARAFRAARAALAELRALAEADRDLDLDAARVHDRLAAVQVRAGENPQPDRVQVASPEQVRARRFEAVFLCGLQADEFPRRAAPEAFLPDADRREILEGVAACGFPCARTSSSASATCSTSAPHAPSDCWCSARG